jgi:hypothetical protein
VVEEERERCCQRTRVKNRGLSAGRQVQAIVVPLWRIGLFTLTCGGPIQMLHRRGTGIDRKNLALSFSTAKSA